MNSSTLEGISPFFIVGHVDRTIAFYRDRLGFQVSYQEPPDDPFFAILWRDKAQIFVKSETAVAPMPNPARHRHIAWDAYVHVPDPDGLATELASRGVTFHATLADTSSGLRGFEIADPDGYVLFFGRPR